MVSVIEPSCGTFLVTSIRFAQLAMASQVMTCLATVTLSPITVAADIEKLAASLGMAKSWTQDEFQATSCPFPKAGLDNGPRAVAGLGISNSGSFTELSGLDPDR
jgi:hypothetical protein